MNKKSPTKNIKKPTGWCSTPTLLITCSSFSRENGHFSINTAQSKSLSCPDQGDIGQWANCLGTIRKCHLPTATQLVCKNLICILLVGGWTTPSEKYDRQLGPFPQISGWKWENVWVAATWSWICLKCSENVSKDILPKWWFNGDESHGAIRPYKRVQAEGWC